MQELLTNKTVEKLKYDLVRDCLVSYEDLSKAEQIAEDNNLNLAQVLIQQNIITEEQLLNFIEAKLHIPSVNLEDYTLDESCLSFISEKDARKYRIIPLFKIEDVLTVAMADPLDLFVLNNLINSINCKIEPIICSERNILRAIQKYYSKEELEFNDFNKPENIKFDWHEELRDEKPDDFQSQRIIRAVIYQAVLEDAKEITFEQTSTGLSIKFKDNNGIADKGSIPVLLAPLCISKLKSMSNLDPGIDEIPQLGKLKLFVDPLNIIASVSTFPTLNGERILIKIYKPPKKLEELPITENDLEQIKTSLKGSGIIFVCGSSLSGKTSVIYSLLSYLQSTVENIMTVESIIKYELTGINQCELNEKVGFDFEKAIKFIDFQSPDVLYFEEIFSKQGLDFILRLAKSGKLILTEFATDDLQVLTDTLNETDYNDLKNLTRCIISVKNDQIKLITQ